MANKVSHIALLFIVVGIVTWLGSFNIRALMSINLLQFGTLEFQPNIHPYVERVVFALIAQGSLIADIGYITVWIAGLFYLRFSHFRLKEHGWLVMSAVLFYVFTPAEIYVMVLDFKMWLLDNAGSNDLVEFRKLFIHRLGALSGVPIIAWLCYYTIIVLFVFKPMQKPSPVSSPTGLN
ncbi:MAG: hypothetical protein ACHQQQ_00360 [Bacteroidota bacterium]